MSYKFIEKNYFLITSYLGGEKKERKKEHTINYINQIRKYVGNNFIVFVDSIPDKDIANLCDIYVNQIKNNNNYIHGQGDLDKIKIGISILDGLKAKNFLRTSYDYWMNKFIFEKYQEWKKLNKKIISSVWKTKDFCIMNSMSMGYGYYDLDAAKKIFNFNYFYKKPSAEEQIYKKLVKFFDKNDYYLFDSCEEMFGCDSFDLFNFAGTKISEKINSLES